MRLLRASLWLALAGLGCACAQQQQAPAPKTIDAEELSRLLEEKKVYFIDVREPEEIKQLGSIAGYVNIPLGQLESRLKEIPKGKLIVTL